MKNRAALIQWPTNEAVAAAAASAAAATDRLTNKRPAQAVSSPVPAHATGMWVMRRWRCRGGLRYNHHVTYVGAVPAPQTRSSLCAVHPEVAGARQRCAPAPKSLRSSPSVAAAAPSLRDFIDCATHARAHTHTLR